MIKNNYSKDNPKPIEYMQSQIQEGDFIVYKSIGVGSVIAVNFPNNSQYFYNEEDWGVVEAYKAFAPQMETWINDDFMNNLSGRIWVIDEMSDACYEQLFNNDNYKFISRETFQTKYQNYYYIITLVEKNKVPEDNRN